MRLSLPFRRVLAILALVAGGYVLRAYGPGHRIPALYLLYGGAAIWAATVYFLVALLLRSRPQKQVLLVAALVCALVEVSKLIHTPALDIFRLTPAGALMLGRIFAGWNFAAYAAGLMLAAILDRLLHGFASTKPRQKSRGRRR